MGLQRDNRIYRLLCANHCRLQFLGLREMDICPNLPNELWLQVINNLGQPVHASAYRLDPGCASTLTQLCRVNRTLNALSAPVLYSRVYVTPDNLDSFSNAIGASDRIGNLNRNVVPSDTAVLVTSLALVGFRKDENHPSMDTYWHRIGCVLVTLKPFLVRLFFDVYSPGPRANQLSSNTYESAMHGAIRALSAIQEFCCTEDSLRPDMLPAWKTVRRMAMAGSWINSGFLEKLSEMEAMKNCILAWPIRLLADVEFKLSVIRGSWVAVRTTELVVAVSDPSYWVLRRLQAAWSKEGDIKHGGKATLKVMEVPQALMRAGHIPERREIWFSQIALDGSIWNLCTEPWDIYSRKINVTEDDSFI
ncbi:hypothetical protein FRB94_012725 [Tulasnella sp. JGI-2019a]|nr:hypothetical protein FRB94_012725 [Tulasnella sp. JGI-2019a]KAG9018437.1 hypothetical protein FRB93_000140 [Tulasnella sp. JGI-2019a]